MMRRFFTGALVGGFLGILAGFAIGIFAYPYIFLADIVADERLDAADMDTVVATGEFIHANPAARGALHPLQHRPSEPHGGPEELGV